MSQQKPLAVSGGLSQRNKMILMIVGGQVMGLGGTLKMLDENTTGGDDLGGQIAQIGGQVMIAIGSDNLRKTRDVLKLNIQVSQQWLLDNLER